MLLLLIKIVVVLLLLLYCCYTVANIVAVVEFFNQSMFAAIFTAEWIGYLNHRLHPLPNYLALPRPAQFSFHIRLQRKNDANQTTAARSGL